MKTRIKFLVASALLSSCALMAPTAIHQSHLATLFLICTFGLIYLLLRKGKFLHSFLITFTAFLSILYFNALAVILLLFTGHSPALLIGSFWPNLISALVLSFAGFMISGWLFLVWSIRLRDKVALALTPLVILIVTILICFSRY